MEAIWTSRYGTEVQMRRPTRQDDCNTNCVDVERELWSLRHYDSVGGSLP